MKIRVVLDDETKGVWRTVKSKDDTWYYTTDNYKIALTEKIEMSETNNEIVSKLCHRFGWLLGCAIECVYEANPVRAIEFLRLAITSKSSPRPRAVTVKEADALLWDEPYATGCVLKHIFAYSRNLNKKELRVALSYLLREANTCA